LPLVENEKVGLRQTTDRAPPRSTCVSMRTRAEEARNTVFWPLPSFDAAAAGAFTASDAGGGGWPVPALRAAIVPEHSHKRGSEEAQPE